jgi:hypothetical protein
MCKRAKRGRVISFKLHGCSGYRYFDDEHLTVEIQETCKAATIFYEMCKLIVGDPTVTSILTSFPPNGAEAWKAKVHALLDMVLETMNEGKRQTTLSIDLIKERMSLYLRKTKRVTR